MTKKLILSVIVLISTITFQAQTYTPTKENLEARALFQDMKLGMFVTWGVSSVLGNGEWVMHNRNIGVKEYSKLIDFHNPQNFDAKKWVATAKSGGMKYITFVTRHHDSFSYWDTKESDWNIMKTPYGKDIVKQLAEECHKQGIKFFCYYSLLDWYRSDYQYETGNTGRGTGRTQKSDWESYIRFMKAQLTELLTNYGEIDGIWFDGYWDQLGKDKTQPAKVDWHCDEIYKLIHSLQPKCLIGNNHHLATLPGEDFQTFEKDLPGKNTSGFGGLSVSNELPLETCETINKSWGFDIADKNYKSTKALIHYVVTAAGMNANFLLNVGPMPDGNIQPEFESRIAELGDWMKKNGESIYGTRGNVIPTQDWGVITTKEKKWYAHIIQTIPINKIILIPNTKAKIKKCFLFGTNKSLKFTQGKQFISIDLNGITLDEVDTIIELQLK
ncbi:alpha-L-fucosidase [Flavobacterium sp.]|uniref:alpha-L-fucosidase n=1 Tax=Flavobacterium sp. TaxID=239 RepID=UPI00286C1D6A|nr:alpha-L-fucosidase [Flavobacterium sp.]